MGFVHLHFLNKAYAQREETPLQLIFCLGLNPTIIQIDLKGFLIQLKISVPSTAVQDPGNQTQFLSKGELLPLLQKAAEL